MYSFSHHLAAFCLPLILGDMGPSCGRGDGAPYRPDYGAERDTLDGAVIDVDAPDTDVYGADAEIDDAQE